MWSRRRWLCHGLVTPRSQTESRGGMSRARVRGPRRKSRSVAKDRQRPVTTAKKAERQSFPEFPGATGKSPKFHRFIGISLGGGKTDKTALSVIEYYPIQRKIFLSRLFDKIQSED